MKTSKQQISKVGRAKMMAFLKKKTGRVSLDKSCPSTKELLMRCERHLGLPGFVGSKRDRMIRIINALGGEIVEAPPKKQKSARKRQKRDEMKGFYESERWMELRYRVLKANNGRCECCGRGKRDGVILHVDHIKPRSRYPELQWEISNLQVLCAACNYGKRAWDETDWREPSLRVVMGEAMK